MDESRFSFDFNFLRVGFWSTIFLILIKYTCDANISLFMAFIPLIISILILFFIVFYIGLITIILVVREVRNQEEDSDYQDNTIQDDEDE